jgi:hypothetical protein
MNASKILAAAALSAPVKAVVFDQNPAAVLAEMNSWVKTFKTIPEPSKWSSVRLDHIAVGLVSSVIMRSLMQHYDPDRFSEMLMRFRNRHIEMERNPDQYGRNIKNTVLSIIKSEKDGEVAF